MLFHAILKAKTFLCILDLVPKSMIQVCYFRQYLAQEGDSGFQAMGMIKGFFWV